MKSSNTAIVVLAAGKGERFGGLKQFLKINGKIILYQTISILLSFKISNYIVVVVPSNKITVTKKNFNNKNIFVISGGDSRYQSTKAALDFLSKKSIKYVYIHDGVRPFINKKIFIDLYKTMTLEKTKGAVSFLPVTDSVVMLDPFNGKKIHLDKKNIITTQTPHLYFFESLYACFLQNSYLQMENAEMLEFLGGSISYVFGPKENVKLTYKNDINLFRKIKGI